MASMQFYLHCFTLQETNINKSLQYKSVIWFCLLCHVSRFFDLMYVHVQYMEYKKSINLPVYVFFQAEDCHGEVMGVVKDANLFVASSYQGNPLLQYICFYCNKATLYHNGR